VIITSYNQHVRLLSPEPWRLTLPSLLRFREPTFHEIRGHGGTQGKGHRGTSKKNIGWRFSRGLCLSVLPVV
jgi:hypothetical protein